MNSQPHLTDDQFAACAAGSAPADALAHIESCAQCRGQVEEFAVLMQDFTTLATRWSERQPSVSLRGRQAWHHRLIPDARVRWAVATILVAAVALPVVLQGDRNPKEPSHAVSNASVDDTAEMIAEDNRLMERVSLALNEPDPSPVDEFGLLADPTAKRAAGSTRNP